MAQIHPKTETAVCNEALSCLKIPEIVSLDADTTKTGRVLRKHFASVRDALLRQYPWNFAEKIALLEAQVAAPAFGFKYVYAFPHDLMAVRHLPDATSRDEWKVRARSIETDLPPPLKCVYTSFAAFEVATWDALFRLADSRLLAVAIGPELGAEDELIEKARAEAENTLKFAYPSDAAEGTPEELPEGDWISCRR